MQAAQGRAVAAASQGHIYPARSKPVPPQSLMKAAFWSQQQTGRLGQYCMPRGSLESFPHRKSRVDRTGLRVMVGVAWLASMEASH